MDGTIVGAARARMEWRIQHPDLTGRAWRSRLSGPIAISILLTVVVSAVFVLWPELDLIVSEGFHRPGEGFAAAADPALRRLRQSSTWVMAGLMLFAASILLKRHGPGAACARRPLCLLVVFLLGPGLLVNGLLKSFWGRARPVNVDAFGGDDPFTPAWSFSQACADNCSFTSGEGASAAWMATTLLLVPAPWRPVVGPPLLTYALTLSLNRVAFGGHFLSDVVLSWCLTGLVAAVAWRLMVETPAAGRARRTRRPGVRRGSVLALS